MRRIIFSLILSSALMLQQIQGQEEEENDVIPNVGHHYPVHIGAENHIVQGRISSQAGPGSLVPSNVIVEGEHDANTLIHLRVEVRKSIYTRPHIYHPDIKLDTSDPNNPQFQHPVIDFSNNTLPYGMEFAVLDTNAFYVNSDRYIVVNNFDHLDGKSTIHFNVILKDTLSEIIYVSNQLPFVIEIEYPVRKKTPEAALSAGVLVLTIIGIALLIPFVVRAKRRAKAGKPICGWGSADDNSETDSMGSAPDFVKNRAMSIGGKENLAFVLENGRLKQHRPSIDPHMTLQDRMIRSTSNLNFQPHWLDPHYSEVYDRPDYNLLQANYLKPNGSTNGLYAKHALNGHAHAMQHAVNGHSGKAHANGAHSLVPHGTPTLNRHGNANSTRSSLSSIGNYPTNFNLGVMPPSSLANTKALRSGDVETGDIKNIHASHSLPSLLNRSGPNQVSTTVALVHGDAKNEAISTSSGVASHKQAKDDVYALANKHHSMDLANDDIDTLPTQHPAVKVIVTQASVVSDSGMYSASADHADAETRVEMVQNAEGISDDSREEIVMADERL